MSALRYVETAPAAALVVVAAVVALGVLVVRRRRGLGALRPVSAVLLAGCVGALAVMTTARGHSADEMRANLVPGRGVDVDDVLLNTAGAALGALVVAAVRRARQPAVSRTAAATDAATSGARWTGTLP